MCQWLHSCVLLRRIPAVAWYRWLKAYQNHRNKQETHSGPRQNKNSFPNKKVIHWHTAWDDPKLIVNMTFCIFRNHCDTSWPWENNKITYSFLINWGRWAYCHQQACISRSKITYQGSLWETLLSEHGETIPKYNPNSFLSVSNECDRILNKCRNTLLKLKHAFSRNDI